MTLNDVGISMENPTKVIGTQNYLNLSYNRSEYLIENRINSFNLKLHTNLLISGKMKVNCYTLNLNYRSKVTVRVQAKHVTSDVIEVNAIPTISLATLNN